MSNSAGNNRQNRHNAALQISNQESTTLGTRTNIFLVVQSILVAGLANIVISGIVALPYVFASVVSGITIVGALYCLIQYKTGRQGALAAFRWRRYMRYIEENKEAGEPWQWFHEQWHHPKLAEWEKPSQREETNKARLVKKLFHKLAWRLNWKTREATLLHKLPWPSTWLFTPTIFSFIWFGAALYISIRLWYADDPIRQSLDTLRNTELDFVIIIVAAVALVATITASAVLICMVVKTVKWWCCTDFET
jgi:hypothetical protein